MPIQTDCRSYRNGGTGRPNSEWCDALTKMLCKTRPIKACPFYTTTEILAKERKEIERYGRQ